MTFTRAEVREFVKPSPCWTGFDDFKFEFEIHPLSDIIQTFRTCWTPRQTFIETGHRFLSDAQKRNDDLIRKVIELADSFKYCGPMLITGFLHRDLKSRWPQEYPSTSSIPDWDIIVEDGNHRLTALAIRHIRKNNIIHNAIGVFIGRL